MHPLVDATYTIVPHRVGVSHKFTEGTIYSFECLELRGAETRLLPTRINSTSVLSCEFPF